MCSSYVILSASVVVWKDREREKCDERGSFLFIYTFVLFYSPHCRRSTTTNRSTYRLISANWWWFSFSAAVCSPRILSHVFFHVYKNSSSYRIGAGCLVDNHTEPRARALSLRNDQMNFCDFFLFIFFFRFSTTGPRDYVRVYRRTAADLLYCRCTEVWHRIHEYA